MNTQQENDYIDLGVLLIDFWKGIRKFWYIVILFMLLGAGAMWGYRYVTYELRCHRTEALPARHLRPDP